MFVCASILLYIYPRLNFNAYWARGVPLKSHNGVPRDNYDGIDYCKITNELHGFIGIRWNYNLGITTRFNMGFNMEVQRESLWNYF